MPQAWPDTPSGGGWRQFQAELGIKASWKILSTEQYCFNQEADLTDTLAKAPCPGMRAAPSLAYLERDEPWLQATFNQFITDDAFYQESESSKSHRAQCIPERSRHRARMLRASGSGMTGTGLKAALARINNLHPAFFSAFNTEAKYIAYTYSAFGQFEGSFSQ